MLILSAIDTLKEVDVFVVIFLSHCGSLCSVPNTSHHSSFSRLVRTTRGWRERWRRSSGRGRSWRGSSGEFWRTWTTRPGMRPTSEISVCLIVVKETKQTCEVLFNLCEQKLPTLHSSYSDSEWTFMRNQTPDRAEVPSQLTVMLWGQSAGRHDEIISYHVLLTSFETVTNYFVFPHLLQYCTFHTTQQSLFNKLFYCIKKHIFRSRN